jgi:hypothetical protein
MRSVCASSDKVKISSEPRIRGKAAVRARAMSARHVDGCPCLAVDTSGWKPPVNFSPTYARTRHVWAAVRPHAATYCASVALKHNRPNERSMDGAPSRRLPIQSYSIASASHDWINQSEDYAFRRVNTRATCSQFRITVLLSFWRTNGLRLSAETNKRNS